MKLEGHFFDRNVVEVASDLVGLLFCVDGVGGMIVETEAYGLNDAAVHSFNRRTV